MDIPSHIHSSGSGSHSSLTKVLIFLAFAIPIALLLYGLYINFLPFGYDKTYSLSVSDAGDISPLSSKIYFTNAQGRKILSLPDGIDGQVNLVVEPDVVLKNASANAVIEGEDISLGVPLRIGDVAWNSISQYEEIVSQLKGGFSLDEFRNCTFVLDASREQSLSLPDSQNMFESGPMTMSITWNPSERSRILGDGQQILGHYNWEIWQNSKDVQFRVGRMNNESGPFYSVSYPTSSDFFGQDHELIAVYSPDPDNGNGYIQLWVDGEFAGRTNIGKDIIYANYNSDKPLSLGWTPHNYGKNPYYDGCIYQFNIHGEAVGKETTSAEIPASGQKITIPIVGKGKLTSISVEVKQ